MIFVHHWNVWNVFRYRPVALVISWDTHTSTRHLAVQQQPKLGPLIYNNPYLPHHPLYSPVNQSLNHPNHCYPNSMLLQSRISWTILATLLISPEGIAMNLSHNHRQKCLVDHQNQYHKGSERGQISWGDVLKLIYQDVGWILVCGKICKTGKDLNFGAQKAD